MASWFSFVQSTWFERLLSSNHLHTGEKQWKCSMLHLNFRTDWFCSQWCCFKCHWDAFNTSMLRYRFPSCRSIRILMIRMSGPESWILLVGLVPQEAERRCDFVGVTGVKAAGVELLAGGDVSTSRQDTDGDFICCNRRKPLRLMNIYEYGWWKFFT